MPLKKDVFGNWIEKKMYREYYLINYKTNFEQYSMQMLEKLFDVIGFS
uniref:Uncharacterized protein n=2 Tax=Physcomitrium patens TaxID=3218 RepID=A0A2K1J9V0_PHYPA|nr:hypothetical protein PHYPA_021400 [Physcomitrium patens]